MYKLYVSIFTSAQCSVFADPNYNGSTDPEIIYNPVTKEFLVYYTSRRPLSGNSFVSTPIGVISSKIYWIGHLRDIVLSMEWWGQGFSYDFLGTWYDCCW